VTRYDLAAMVERRKGTTAILPPIEDSAGARSDYLKALRAMLRGANAYVRSDLLPEVEREMTANLTRDIGEGLFARLAGVFGNLAYAAEQMVDRILGLEAKRHTAKFKAQAKKALGVDLSAVVREEDLTGYLENAATRNVGLIRGLSADLVKRFQERVTTALIQGETAKALRKTLTEEFGIADRRAQLVAADQIAKLNSDMNRIRHEQAGVTSYKWMTSRDERVRPLHRELEGKVYTYGEETGAEGGLPPGQPIRCRCIARGIVQF
jgi:SPP1 gp7 family putative phage head morphogenesis protein